jgi:hypothetical protein
LLNCISPWCEGGGPSFREGRALWSPGMLAWII